MESPMSHQTFFTEQRHLNDSGVALYVDALTLHQTEKLPQDILHHVEQCEDCKSNVVGVADLMKDQHSQQIKKHPYFDAAPSLEEQFSQVYRIAAVFLLIIIGGALYLILFNHTTISTQVDTSQSAAIDSIHSQQDRGEKRTEQFAANFIPSANLDDLVKTEFRSAAFEVVSPQIGDIVRTPITFRWKNYNKPLKIKIVTNREVTLLTSMVNTNAFVTSKTFAPGLYYWKLEKDDELVYIGKFFVQ